jgi:hypothetical protein
VNTRTRIKEGNNPHLPSGRLLDLEKVIQTSLLDRLQERCGDIHMRVQTMLPRRQLGQSRDGRLEMCRIAREVAD